MPYNQPVPRYVIRPHFDLTLPYHIKGTGINTEGEGERDKKREREQGRMKEIHSATVRFKIKIISKKSQL